MAYHITVLVVYFVISEALFITCKADGLDTGLYKEKNIKSKLRLMFEQQIETDVNFLITDDLSETNYTIGAHRSVLLAASPYLSNVLRDVPWESTVSVTNVDQEAFLQILRYVYGSRLSMTEQNVMKILHAARSYQVTGLEKRCLFFIGQRINTNNVLSFLEKGIEANESKVITYCKSLIETGAETVLRSGKFLTISQDLLSLILDMPALSAPEITIVEATLDWAKTQQLEQIEQRTHQIPSKREILGDAFYKLRLPTLTSDQLNKVIFADGDLLSDKEQLQLYRYLTYKDSERAKLDLPFTTEARGFYADLQHALLIDTELCGLKAPQASTLRLPNGYAYAFNLEMSSIKTDILLRGLRLAVPFFVVEEQNVPVESLSIRFKRKDTGCRTDYNRERCYTKYPDVSKVAISSDRIFPDSTNHPFTYIFWERENEVNLNPTTSFTIQYNFTLPTSVTENPFLVQMSEEFYMRNNDKSIYISMTANSPVMGAFFTTPNALSEN